MCIGTSSWQQDIRKSEYITAIVQSAILVWVLAYLFYDSWIAFPVLMPLGAVYLYQWREEKCTEKETLFLVQFRDAVQMLSSALRTGYSVENAIRETEKELRSLYPKSSRIRNEFERMARGLNMNMTAEQVLKEFAQRTAQEDVQHFADVFAASKRTGGDSMSILKSSIHIISDKIDTERQIQTILASKKLEFQIMCVVPLGLILYMRFAFSEFLAVLYKNVPGVLIMTACLAVYAAAYRMGKKMIQIEV